MGKKMLGPKPAGTQAAKPLEVDDEALEATFTAVDAFLEANAIELKGLGDLVSTLKKDPAQFALANGLIFAFSGGTISFDSASQLVSTTAKCGLTPNLVPDRGCICCAETSR